MMVSPTRKKIIIGVAIFFLAVMVWLVGGAVSKNNTYKRLEKATAKQTFAGKLGSPRRSSIECYPDGKSSTCSALVYTISASGCRDIATLLGGIIKKDGECGFARDTQTYQGVTITYITGKAKDGAYILTVSEGKN